MAERSPCLRRLAVHGGDGEDDGGFELRVLRRGDISVLVACGGLGTVLQRCKHAACGNELILEVHPLPPSARGLLERHAHFAATLERTVVALAELELPVRKFDDPDASRELEDDELLALASGAPITSAHTHTRTRGDVRRTAMNSSQSYARPSGKPTARPSLGQPIAR